MEDNRLAVTVDEASTMLGISRAALYPLVLSGEVPSFKVGARRLIPTKGLREWVERSTTGKGGEA